MTKKVLDALPTVRLYYQIKPHKCYYTIPYMNARKAVQLSLLHTDFKPNGKGLPWTCGISNAILRQKDLFDHTVYYAHTIGSVVYVVAMLTESGQPKFAFRYRHRAGPLVDAYDASRRSRTKIKTFLNLLSDRPVLTLEVGRSESGKGAHSPGSVSGHRAVGAPHGDLNKEALSGIWRRMRNAGFTHDQQTT